MRCEHQSVVVCESFGLVSRLMLVCSPALIEAEALSVHLQDMDMVSKAGPSADLEWRDECGFRDEVWDFHLSYGYSNMPCLIANPIVRPPMPTRVRIHQESSQRNS